MNSNEIPKNYCCPITLEIMKDPVVAADGHSYEKSAIEEWVNLSTRDPLSPMTGSPLIHTMLTPNYTLRSQINEFLEKKSNTQQQNTKQNVEEKNINDKNIMEQIETHDKLSNNLLKALNDKKIKPKKPQSSTYLTKFGIQEKRCTPKKKKYSNLFDRLHNMEPQNITLKSATSGISNQTVSYENESEEGSTSNNITKGMLLAATTLIPLFWIFTPITTPLLIHSMVTGSKKYKEVRVEAVANYRRNRENGNNNDSPAWKFPNDGKYDLVDGENEFMTTIKKIRYTEGHKDKKWMEEKDRNYLQRINGQSNNNTYRCVMDSVNNL